MCLLPSKSPTDPATLPQHAQSRRPPEPLVEIKPPQEEAKVHHAPIRTSEPVAATPKRVFPKKVVDEAPAEGEVRAASPVHVIKRWGESDTAMQDEPKTVADTNSISTISAVADCSDIGISIRWWNAPASWLSLAIVAVLGGLGLETLPVSGPQPALVRVMNRPDASSEVVRDAARRLVSSPLTLI